MVNQLWLSLLLSGIICIHDICKHSKQQSKPVPTFGRGGRLRAAAPPRGQRGPAMAACRIRFSYQVYQQLHVRYAIIMLYSTTCHIVLPYNTCVVCYIKLHYISYSMDLSLSRYLHPDPQTISRYGAFPENAVTQPTGFQTGSGQTGLSQKGHRSPRILL